MSYTYSKVTSPNGIVLHALKTSPNNIILDEIQSNVCSQSQYGVNGGFFYGTDQISIAVNDDIPVRGVKDGYGSGWFNEKYVRGTLVWDAVARKYSVQAVHSADELIVTDRSQYWAQGGVSMTLQDDSTWHTIADAQVMPNRTGETYRTALVYNTGLNIWLVVTRTPCTASSFRYAIKASIGNGSLVDGIFLDGGGSTQMKSATYNTSGDGRRVVQMVALKAI